MLELQIQMKMKMMLPLRPLAEAVVLVALVVPLYALHGAGGQDDPPPPGHAGPGVHLSLGRRAGDIVASWSTPFSRQPAYLLYGSSPGALDSRVFASSEVLANDEAKAGPAAKAVQWRNVSVHRALITDLVGGAPVFYSVSGDPVPGRVLNFTYSIPHERAGAVTFAIFGDLAVKEQDGANYTLARLKELRRSRGFDAVLHVGDIAYDLRQDAGRTGDEFLVDMEEVASAVPYMTCPGNHERDCVAPGGASPRGTCGDPPYTNYRKRFAMPTPPNGSGSEPVPMYWSTDIGSARVISLNTDTYILPGMAAAQHHALEGQLAWLEADLQAATAPVQRRKVPWIVAIGHEMLYSSFDANHKAQAKLLREGGTTASWGAFAGLEKLFHDYGVDLYFSGHEHVYEHYARIYQGRPCENATAGGAKCGLPDTPMRRGCPCTAHIVVGNAGNREFPYRNKNGTIAAFQYPKPRYEEFRSTSPAGFGLLAVHNESVMSWQQYNARTGETIDEHVYHR